jgi:3-phenylpropionate/cinnamic acid dioxygenase small subunit
MTPDEIRAIEWECQRVIVRYANLNDQRRWHEVAALYIEDGSMVRPSAPGEKIVGRAAILASLLARPAERATRHLCTNVEVTVEAPDAATASSTYLIYSGVQAEAGPPVSDGRPPSLCEFRDRLRKTPEGWRFVERVGAPAFTSNRGGG